MSNADNKEKSRNRDLLTNSIWRLSQIMSSGGFTVVYVLLYTSVLSKSEYGVYSVAITLNQFLQIGSNFGLRQTINRFVAKARGAESPTEIRSYIKTGFAVSSAISAVSLVLTLAFSFYLVTFLREQQGAYLIVAIVACSVGLSGVSLFLQGVLEGLGKFKHVMIMNAGVHVVQLSLLGLFLLGTLDVIRVLIIETAAIGVAIALYGAGVLKRYRGLPKAPSSATPIAKKLLRFGLPLGVNMLGGFLYTKVDVLFVKAYLTSADAADYFLMLHIFSFPLRALGAYLFVLNTEVTVCLGARKLDRIYRLFVKSETFGALLGVALSVLFYFTSYGVVWILPEYEGCAHLMRLIAPLIALKCVTQIASGAFLISLGKVNIMAAFTLSGGLLNVALNFVMIPAYGVDGAVYATLLGHTLTGVATLTYVVWNLRRMKES